MGRHTVYRLFESALPVALCDLIVAAGRRLEAHVAGLKPEGEEAFTDEAIRKTRIAFWDATHWINGLTTHYLHLANQEVWRYQLTVTQGVQFGIYEPSGKYDWHKDEFDQPFGEEGGEIWQGLSRKLSVMVNLSDDAAYEGGDLKFKDTWGQEIDDPQFQQVVRRQGSVVVFPAYVVHTVSPVVRGVRYSVVSWMLGPPFR